MDAAREQGTWIQCAHCGHMYYIERNVSNNKLYITSECSRCGCKKGLNCGSNESEIYDLYNLNLDERYFKY